MHDLLACSYIYILFSDIDVSDDDALKSIGAAGSYCFTLAANDDEIVEEEETFIIGVNQGDTLQDTTLSVTVTDNDSKQIVCLMSC